MFLIQGARDIFMQAAKKQIKAIVKATLPPAAIRYIRTQSNLIQLQFVPKHSMSAANLRVLQSADIARIFADEQIEDSWNKDLQTISQFYKSEHLSGGVNPGDRRALYYLIRGMRPANLLEVGTHIGASTIFMAHAQKAASAQDKRFSTVDILDVNSGQGAWKSVGLSAPPAELIAQSGCKDHVEFHNRPATEFMKSTNERFDFIFLDGDHSAKAVYEEVGGALPILNPNGVILLHDYYPDLKPLFPDGNVIEGPFLGMRRVCRENPDISVIPLGDLPWPTKQGVHKTSLALVTKKS
jgi:predicted O-methyltransferase YrrM